MKKEVKKKSTKKVTKKELKKIHEPASDVSIGSLLVCINDFNSEIFLEKIFLLFGILLIIVGTWRLYDQAKKEKKKSSTLYLATCIIFIVVFTMLIVGSFIL